MHLQVSQHTSPVRPVRGLSNWLCALTLFANITPLSAEPETKPSLVKITLADGNHLSGESISTTGNAELSLSSSHLLKPAKLKLSHLRAIQLNFPPLPAARQPQVVVYFHPRFRMEQVDAISGTLLAIDPQHIVLQTNCAGTIKIKRQFVSDIETLASGKGYYRGPKNAEEWDQGDDKDAWRFKNGRLYSLKNGGVGRDVKLATYSRVCFRAKWEKSMRFRVQLYSSDYQTNTPAAFYEINFNRSYAYLRIRGKARNKTNTIMGGGWKQIRFNQNLPWNTLDLFTDRKKGTVRIFIDGVDAATLQAKAADPVNLGTGMRFIAEQRYPIQISNIRVHPWDGKTLPLPPKQDVKKPTNLTSLSMLVDTKGNQHAFASLKKDQQHFILTGLKKAAQASRIAIEDVAKLLVSNDKAAEPKKYLRDVLCQFRDGSTMTLQLKQIHDGKLITFSQPLGETTFDIRAFSLIEFNIYDHDSKKLRNAAP